MTDSRCLVTPASHVSLPFSIRPLLLAFTYFCQAVSKETPIERHIKVQNSRSPYDGDWVYWSSRMGRHPEVNGRVATLLKRQEGKCPECNLFFKEGDILEVDHRIPRSQGGKDEYINLQLLHRHCHDTKTANDNHLAAL